jgi:hypothetical protein
MTYPRCNCNPYSCVGVIHVACFPKGITPTFVPFYVSPTYKKQDSPVFKEFGDLIPIFYEDAYNQPPPVVPRTKLLCTHKFYLSSFYDYLVP